MSGDPGRNETGEDERKTKERHENVKYPKRENNKINATYSKVLCGTEPVQLMQAHTYI